MFRPDFGHLYKYISSVGLIAVAAAIVLPWFVLQANDSLLLKRSSLNLLTAEARRALLERQHLIAEVQAIMLWVSLFLFLGGIVLITWGFRGWRRQQDRHEQSENEDLKRKRLDYSLASPAEVREEERKEEAVEVSNELAQRPGQREGGSIPASTAIDEPDRRAAEERRSRLRSTEALFADRLALAFANDYGIDRNVKISTSSGRTYLVDALAQPNRGKSWAPFVTNVTARSSPMMLPMLLNDKMSSLAIAASSLGEGSLPTGARGRPPTSKANAVLHLLMPSESSRAVRHVDSFTEDLNAVLRRPVAVIIWELDLVDSIPIDLDEIRAATVSALAQPGVVQRRSLVE